MAMHTCSALQLLHNRSLKRRRISALEVRNRWPALPGVVGGQRTVGVAMLDAQSLCRPRQVDGCNNHWRGGGYLRLARAHGVAGNETQGHGTQPHRNAEPLMHMLPPTLYAYDGRQPLIRAEFAFYSRSLTNACRVWGTGARAGAVHRQGNDRA